MPQNVTKPYIGGVYELHKILQNVKKYDKTLNMEELICCIKFYRMPRKVTEMNILHDVLQNAPRGLPPVKGAGGHS